jgi:tRNA threonylcarbamoyladenosine biosynthesis protein TsaB
LSPLTFSPSAGYNRADVVTLALDTTTPAGSLAVAREGRLLRARRGVPDRPHGERLPGDIVALLEEVGVALTDVSLFAVARGPGGFTGLRIGIAAIQGLAFALRTPVVGVSALDALAQAGCEEASLPPGTMLGAWMDAARHEVFAALYQVVTSSDAGSLARVDIVDPPSVGAPGAVLGRWMPLLEGRPACLVGEGAVRYRSAIADGLPTAGVLGAWPPLAAAMVPLAIDAAARGLAGSPHAIRPLYVRRPDAEIARDRRAAGDRP